MKEKKTKRRTKIVLVTFVLLSLLFSSVYVYNINNKAEVVKPKRTTIVHNMYIYFGLLGYVKNEHELAAAIAHEFAHLELGHTLKDTHSIYDEYQADILSVYYIEKAGFNVCAIAKFWERKANEYIQVKPSSHPLKISRANYMKLDRCKNVKIKDKEVGLVELADVYTRLSQAVEIRIRAKTRVILVPVPVVNAGVASKEVEVD